VPVSKPAPAAAKRSPAAPAAPAAPAVPTAERIIDAAERHFATHGYAATSLNDIADDVGIRTPSLYKHFASKRELYRAVLGRLLDPYVSLLGGLLVPAEDAAQAEANLAAVLDHYLRTPRLASLVQHAALGDGEELELVVARHRPLFARATRLSRRVPGQPQDPAQLVMTFHALISGYVTLAPFHARLTGKDPLAPAALAGFRALTQRLARGLWGARGAAPARSGSRARRPARG
jgi:AcrR family transcriptional regulator